MGKGENVDDASSFVAHAKQVLLSRNEAGSIVYDSSAGTTQGGDGQPRVAANRFRSDVTKLEASSTLKTYRFSNVHVYGQNLYTFLERVQKTAESIHVRGSHVYWVYTSRIHVESGGM